MIFFFRSGFFAVIFLSASLVPSTQACAQTSAESYKKPIDFDCSRTTLGVDYVICASPQLMDAEARLEEAYRAARASQGDEVKMAQREWSKSYGPNCGLPARGQPSSAESLRARDCVLNSMNKRTAYLQSLVGGVDLPSKQEQPTPPSQSDTSSSTTAPPPPPVQASTKAQAAFEYLVQTLNGNVALLDRRDTKTGNFAAIDGDLCHIRSQANLRITGVGIDYAVAYDSTQEFYARDLDMESLSIVDFYKQGAGSYSTRVMKFKTIGNKVAHKNNFVCQLSCGSSKFKSTDTADSIIFNGNEDTILRAAMTLAGECGAKVRDF